MREYICTDDLKGLDQYAYGVEEVIAELPTITKADICKEFLNRLAFICPKSLFELWETVDLMLAEMEKE